MTPPDDPGLLAVLAHFGVGPDAWLGSGGEACVYAVGNDRVLRVLRRGGLTQDLIERRDLVDGLRRSASSFALPHILEIGQMAGRAYAVERRLPGRSALEALRTAHGPARRRLVESYLETAAALGDLRLERHQTFGELIGPNAIATTTWSAYLVQRAAANLSRSTSEFWAIDPHHVADGLPEPTEPAFVHLDAYAGNMLADGGTISAVLDVGDSSVAGDRRLDPLSAVVYLSAPEITPMATSADIDLALAWLRNVGLEQWLVPARRWLAAYWSFAVDDATLHWWCRDVLIGGRRRP
jgi:aminoglycoside phosphotransferase (APT) family kinase protein